MRTLCLIYGFFGSAILLGLCNQLELDPHLDRKPFQHASNSALTWLLPHHSASDVVIATGYDASLNAKFSYGLLSKDLEDEEVEVWLDTCSDKLVFLGSFKTDSDGRIHPTFSSDQMPSKGVFRGFARVSGDGTFTVFQLRILETGSKLVVFDIDGTLTYSDLNPTLRSGAVDITTLIADSGREIIYLSGRHYLLTGYTRSFLSKEGFAPGALILAQSLLEIIPINEGVGMFKAQHLKSLIAMGFVLEQAYGNSKTDNYAYTEAGLAAGQIFIIGPGGNLGEDFLGRLRELLANL